jgi:hypothetical protein
MSDINDELRRIMAYGKCHEGVSRNGNYEPCDKTAVAVRVDDPDEDEDFYPVCIRHTRTHDLMVPLARLAEAFGESRN